MEKKTILAGIVLLLFTVAAICGFLYREPNVEEQLATTVERLYNAQQTEDRELKNAYVISGRTKTLKGKESEFDRRFYYHNSFSHGEEDWKLYIYSFHFDAKAKTKEFFDSQYMIPLGEIYYEALSKYQDQDIKMVTYRCNRGIVEEHLYVCSILYIKNGSCVAISYEQHPDIDEKGKEKLHTLCRELGLPIPPEPDKDFRDHYVDDMK